MKSILLKNASAVLPDRELENSSLLIEQGEIKEIFPNAGSNNLSADETIDLQGARLFAGFIDIHNHGAVGVDVNEASVESLREVGKFLTRYGVTAWLPTFVPDADENYARVIKAIEELKQIQESEPLAQILGVHYEGVFANPNMSGALRPQFFKTFSGKELNEIPTLSQGVHVTTLAPEITGGIELIKELNKQGWVCSIGHTKADFATLNEAKQAGAKHLTHFFNAMTGLHHRDVGVVGFGLANDDVTFDIIADKIHVHPEMLKLACCHKTPEKVILISDCVLPTGLGDGEFALWGEKISVTNGKTRNERGSIAGSVITMLDAVKNMLSLGFTPVEVSKMASLNPAKLIGVEKTHGSIEPGKRADLVALDEHGEVKLCLVGGQ
jgi:N-acetylglucosamine-6-phosphate deacetylase